MINQSVSKWNKGRWKLQKEDMKKQNKDGIGIRPVLLSHEMSITLFNFFLG